VVPAERVSRFGTGARFAAEPSAGYGEPRRVPGGGAAGHAGVTWERVDAEDGVRWPRPSVDRPGPPRLSTSGSAIRRRSV
jgi:assimilatory nitrate reductase catalytic subunit